MPRVACYERKKTYMVSLPPTVADWIRAYGGGNLSGGVLDLVRQVTDVDALYPERLRKHYAYPQQPPSPDARRLQADEQVKWDDVMTESVDLPGERVAPRPPLPEPPPRRSMQNHEEQEAQRLEQIRRNTANATQAIRDGRISSTVKHFIDRNAERVGQGGPVFNMNHMRGSQPDMVDAVESDALALYGCKSGTPSKRLSIEEAQKIAAERGYKPEWVAAVTAEPQHAAPAPEAESLTLTPPASAPQRPGPNAETPAEVHHQEPVF